MKDLEPGQRGCNEQPVAPKRIVLAIAEPEYETHITLPAFAAGALHSPFGFEIVEVGADPIMGNRLSGFVEALAEADLLILSIRRRALHPQEMAALKRYLAAGKPLIGIRTASHAFAPRGEHPAGFVTWPQFDAEIFGGSYHGHHGVGPKTAVTLAPDSNGHAILQGVQLPFTGHGSLYQVRPLGQETEPLLIGRIDDAEPEPVAWTRTVGSSRIFYTSLGHKDDFREPSFIRLLRNASLWAMEQEIPAP